MKRTALGFTLMLAVSPLFAWSFGSNNSDSGFSFGNGPNSRSNNGSSFSFGSNRPNSGSSWSFGNGPNSGSNWSEDFNENFDFSEGFSFGDGFNFGDGMNFGNGPNFNSGWGNRGFGNNYRPYRRDGFHRNRGSGFNFGSNNRPRWNQGPNYGAGQPPMWVPPTYPGYMMPPPPMYYYPVPVPPKQVPNQLSGATPPEAPVQGQAPISPEQVTGKPDLKQINRTQEKIPKAEMRTQK